MPVEEHEVHEKVKIASDKPYGCYNRESMAKGYYAPDRRYRPDGSFYVIGVFIPHELSTDCRYDKYPEDPRCTGCNTKKDVEYLNRMAAL